MSKERFSTQDGTSAVLERPKVQHPNRRGRPKYVPKLTGEEASELDYETMLRKYYATLIASAGGNLQFAARVSGLGRATLYRALRKYGLSGERDIALKNNKGDE